MRWMNHKKSRVMDFFRRIDKDQDGKITRQEFIDGILASSTASWTFLLILVFLFFFLNASLTMHCVCRVPYQQAGDDSCC